MNQIILINMTWPDNSALQYNRSSKSWNIDQHNHYWQVVTSSTNVNLLQTPGSSESIHVDGLILTGFNMLGTLAQRDKSRTIVESYHHWLCCRRECCLLVWVAHPCLIFRSNIRLPSLRMQVCVILRNCSVRSKFWMLNHSYLEQRTHPSHNNKSVSLEPSEGCLPCHEPWHYCRRRSGWILAGWFVEAHWHMSCGTTTYAQAWHFLHQVQRPILISPASIVS